MARDNWDSRARSVVPFHGETFYTITPLPLYVARRRVVLQILARYASVAQSALDFGCGDGWWLEQLARSRPSGAMRLTGLDASPIMVQRAQTQAPSADIYVSDGRIRLTDRHDLIYVVGVLAHLSDAELTSALEQMVGALTPGGVLMVCEQIAPVTRSGRAYTRRTADAYIELVRDRGLSIELVRRIDFRRHRFFEHRVARLYYRHVAGGADDTERRLNANRQVLFRSMSAFFLLFDKAPIRNDLTDYGNLVLVARKHDQSAGP